ncbi:hypothetical protein BBJ28_00019972, partial [Nothophytophthora sp. Chile5]
MGGATRTAVAYRAFQATVVQALAIITQSIYLPQVVGRMDRVVDLVAALQPYAELATPLEFQYLHAQVEELSLSLGLASDQLRYVLCLFAAYPLAVVYKLLPTPGLKHLMDVGVGVCMAQFVLGSGWVH